MERSRITHFLHLNKRLARGEGLGLTHANVPTTCTPQAPVCHRGVGSCREGETLHCLRMQRVQGPGSGNVIGKEGIKITFDAFLLTNVLHFKAYHEEHFTERSPKASVRSPLLCYLLPTPCCATSREHGIMVVMCSLSCPCQ